MHSGTLRKAKIQKYVLVDEAVTNWTESITVLQLLISAGKKQNIFAALSVAVILRASTIPEWKTSVIGTRETFIERLSQTVWLFGPNWLRSQPYAWAICLQPVTTEGWY